MDAPRDWSSWHSPYDDPDSPLSRRLAIVSRHVADWLDSAGRPVMVLSSCAGDGRDLLGVLTARGNPAGVSATLLELDERNAARAVASADAAGLSEVTVRRADAGLSDSYMGAVPADLVLLCGILGNISDEDVARLVRAAPQLCNPGATVIWTRHTRSPDLTPRIRRWFGEAGFEELEFTAPGSDAFSVGVCILRGAPQPLVPGVRLFSFTR
ncbi:MAG: SAM-dependent methyltransferase [Nocardioidaceae bacterium]